MKKEKRAGFYIPVNGKLIAVTEEIYTVYYKMDRRERYLEERDTKHGTVYYNEMDTDEMSGVEAIYDPNAASVEQIVMDTLMREKLHRGLVLLPESDRELIDALFFQGMSERQAAPVFGLSQKGINKRKARILATLKNILES